MNKKERDLTNVLSTTGQLAEALKQTLLDAEPVIDITKLKFVLYVRKSTSGDEKQERSLEDQIADCIEMQINKNNLNLVEIVREKESAKAPGIRPKFKKMLEDIQRGKYDAVLAWHPDRLARNMKDAGEIIYLLEENIIKDLRFATFTFENSPMGKMLLGMSFVLSKQYSDHLREQVLRGQKRSTQAGLSIHTPKQGYYKDINKRLRPDGDNWLLIKRAFEMRLEGQNYKAIEKYLNENKYTRAPVANRERNMHYKVVDNTLTVMFSDPVYAGVMQYGTEIVDLTEIYDFIPMITVQEYCKLNNYTYNGISFISKKPIGVPRNKEMLLRGIIKCAECGSDMISGITTKYNKAKTKKTSYYMFRCNNPSCSVCGKSFRSRVALEFVYDYFKKCDFTSKDMYNQMVKEKEETTKQVETSLDSRLRSLRQQKTERTKTYERTKEIVRRNDPTMMKHFNSGDLDQIQKEIKYFESQIKETQAQIENLKNAIPTYEKYFELFKDMVEILINTHNIKLKDQIIRKYFLNLILKAQKKSDRADGKPVFEWSVTDFTLTPNYEKLLLITNGAPRGI